VSVSLHPGVCPPDLRHAVLDRPLMPPFPAGARTVLFGMGCFWGAEKQFWQQQDVYLTAVGYAGGHTQDPGYRAVCGGNTGHAEVVLVVFEGDDSTFVQLLDVFWESHDPTQGMRQGNDIGSQYRSAIFTEHEADLKLANASRDRYHQYDFLASNKVKRHRLSVLYIEAQ
jgi:peptide-methionine (S)-S-oxide reductase